MLTIANIKSSAKALDYYSRDNYYTKGSPEQLASSEWYGKGAEALNLEGTIDKDSFKQVLDGKLPNGIELGRKEKGEIVHAPGLDLTFSAPKSVSIVSEVHGDTRIRDAHNTAVKYTLDFIERNYMSTRKKVDDVLITERTDNAIIATFLHNVSRDLDPQLHTHCVLANATCREDGEWRSGYFKQIFKDKLYLGQIYRHQLSYELKQLGFDIRPAGYDSKFEIKDIPRSLIEEFSNRSKEIAKAAKNYEYVDAKLKAELALTTRERKVDIAPAELKQSWLSRVEEHNKNMILQEEAKAAKDLEVSKAANIKEQIKNPNAPEKPQTAMQYIQNKWQQFCEKFALKQTTRIRPLIMDYEVSKRVDNITQSSNNEKPKEIDFLSKSLDHAINHVSERQSVWEEKALISAAMSYGVGIVRYEEIVAKLEEYKQKGIILEAKNTFHDFETPLTSKAMLKKEVEIIKYVKSSKDSTQQVCSKAMVKEYLTENGASLSKGQKEAATLILTSKDRIVAVQGYAGTGKTYMLETVRKIAEKHEHKLIGLATSASAARTLQDSAGLESKTIHGFLYRYNGVINDRATIKGLEKMTEDFKNTIVVVDEASLASTNQITALMKLSQELNFKVVYIGDTKQLNGVEAGKPFWIAQRAGIATAIMDETKRYTNENQKAAVQNIIDNKIAEALEKLETNIIAPSEEQEFKNLGEKRVWLVKKAVEHWTNLDDTARNNTLITAPSNSIRSMINDKIRERLGAEGVLTGDSVLIETLSSKDLTRAQRLYIGNYEIGDALLFSSSFESLEIEKQNLLRVTDIKDNNLILVNDKGKSITVDIEFIAGQKKSSFEVYNAHELSVKVGDNMVWTRNCKERPEVINSAQFKITSISDGNISYSMDGKETLTIPLTDPVLRHIEYGYAITAHAAQGRTYQNVIGVIESEHVHLTHQKMFYVTVSRAKENAFLVTDNKEALSETLSTQHGETLSALEHQSKRAPKIAQEALQKEDVKQQSKVMVYPEHKIKDIYHAIYNKLPNILPEFGFRQHGSYLMSSTEYKVDGSFGKKGKVYVYANNPGTIVDFTRGTMSIWEYVKQNYMPAASNHEMMSYLCDMAGLSNTGYTIDRSAIEAKKNMFEAAKVEAEAIPQKTERELKILSLVQEYASQKILDGQNKVLEYLQKERGYTTEQIKAMGLGAIFSKNDLAHFLKANEVIDKEIKEVYKSLHQIGKSHNLLIPYKDIDGKVQGFAGRNIEYQDTDKFGKYLYTKGLYKSSSLLNIDNLKASGSMHAVVVEGMLDALNANANGMKHVVALGGTSCNFKQLGLLKDCGIKEITLALDNDKAGQEATSKITQALKDSKLYMTLKTVDLPKAIKDPDQLIREKGIKAFEQTITQGKIIHEPSLPKATSKAMNMEAEL